jgi:hypothetical protein
MLSKELKVQHTLGFIMYGKDPEVMEEDTFGKGSFEGLSAIMAKAGKIMETNPKVKQINVYETRRDNPPQRVHMLVRTDYKPEDNSN